MYLWFYVLLREDDAETDSTADKVRILSVTISTASVVIRGTSGAVTTTASDRVCPALGRALRVDRRTYTIVFPFEIVKAPFPNVASHVVKTEFVRQFLFDVVDAAVAISRIPSYLINIIAAAIEVALRLVATTGSVFPFCLGRETEMHAVQLVGSKLVESVDETLTIVPRDTFYRKIDAHILCRIGVHHLFPELLCHFGLADIIG